MGEVFVVMNALVVMTTVGQFVNYYLLGKMRREARPMSDGHAYLFIAVLGGFALSEAYVAVTLGLWSYWGYVALNAWGLWHLMRNHKGRPKNDTY